MKTLYLECYSGISGDMTVGSLLDLGVEKDDLLNALKSLHLDGYKIYIHKVFKNGIEATSFDVELTDSEEISHVHTHSENGHTHTHSHVHGHERGLKEILPMIRESSITPKAKETAEKIFQVLAVAEGEVHGVPPEEVVFHEVGAIDSIVDIVSAAVCLDILNITKIVVSPLYEGTGYVQCRHGLVPVPAPATLKLVNNAAIPLVITKNKGEMVTPTGAAIVAALADEFGTPENFMVKSIGVGAGKKDFDHANILRAMLIDQAEKDTDEICVLQSDIDDSTPEQLAYSQKILFDAGALDVHFAPIYMKKNRPAQELTVLCRLTEEPLMTELIFKETSTIGIRSMRARRNIMERTFRQIDIGIGTVTIKDCRYHGIEKKYVEYQSAAELAAKSGESLDEIYRKVYVTIDEMSKMQNMQE